MDEDAELVVLARAGDPEAYGVLFVRHRAVAERVARRSACRADVDDVVAEAFTLVLAQIRGGRGPVSSFRAYLLTAVRHEAARRSVLARRCEPTAGIESLTTPISLPESDEDVCAAYRTLPERWQRVLWQLEVEGRRPHELAAELGLSANAVSALGTRARAGLRSAYLGRTLAA
ncbi:sigma-70 family RNA polymerase sigma factor [Aeromicrobium sp. SMF47]|uniref:RNA polymerase sigma factor n=1 Tax=Aeromicrobium yanjiei TaxID=2662028 RepID=UPI00129DF963|nr:sigma-70 family RNA polymerase sigma factor [Aeromicrobium yanjiei]MRJ76367.1 sigma-70 family RNA polymerase sigma factor [Aeromicrobium yanjiei]